MFSGVLALYHRIHGDCHAFMFYLCGEQCSKDKAQEHYDRYLALKKRA